MSDFRHQVKFTYNAADDPQPIIQIPSVINCQDIITESKDKDGNILTPVCYYCGNLERSQGSGQLIDTTGGQKNKGQANMKLVHTADVYLTVRSPKGVYKKNGRIYDPDVPCVLTWSSVYCLQEYIRGQLEARRGVVLGMQSR